MTIRGIDIPKERLAEFCRRWRIKELALFGSVLRDDFSSDSDIDVLVSFTADAHTSLFNMVEIKDELEEILGRKVDLVSRRGIEMSRNPYRRESILGSAEVVYAEG
jgi:hypothetical protein